VDTIEPEFLVTRGELGPVAVAVEGNVEDCEKVDEAYGEKGVDKETAEVGV
jgi:hypothetical protein